MTRDNTDLEKLVRETLRSKAGAVAPSTPPRRSLLKLSLIRMARNVSATTLLLASVLLGGIALANILAPDERAFAAIAVEPVSQRDEQPQGQGQDQAAPGDPTTLPALRGHARCLRARGFDLPDPIATESGWQIIVEESARLPSESPDYDTRRRWAQAVFVDCRLMDVSGDLVLGGRTRRQIERLRSCVRGEGFELPPAAESRPGEFVFDVESASPTWGSEDWYRTVFVTCGLWRSP